MECYVGLDVSLKQTSLCVVDQTGSVVREGVVDSDPEAISVYVRSKAPDAVRIGLETGPTSTWLWTELKKLGLPVVCIDARHAKAALRMQINKSDQNTRWASPVSCNADGTRRSASKTSTVMRSKPFSLAELCSSRSSGMLRTRSAGSSRTSGSLLAERR